MYSFEEKHGVCFDDGLDNPTVDAGKVDAEEGSEDKEEGEENQVEHFDAVPTGDDYFD